jgi:hypothetical protein
MLNRPVVTTAPVPFGARVMSPLDAEVTAIAPVEVYAGLVTLVVAPSTFDDILKVDDISPVTARVGIAPALNVRPAWVLAA